MVFCNYGPDTQNATKAAVGLGLNKKMKFGGILCGNEVAVGMPVDDIVGSIWGYVWGPEAGGADTAEIYDKLKPRAKGFPTNWRQYLGYISGQQIVDRLTRPERPTPRSSSRRSKVTTTTPARSNRKLLARVRPSGDPTDLRRDDRAEEQAAQRRRVLRDHLDRRRRIRGRELLEPRQRQGRSDHLVGRRSPRAKTTRCQSLR